MHKFLVFYPAFVNPTSRSNQQCRKLYAACWQCANYFPLVTVYVAMIISKIVTLLSLLGWSYGRPKSS